MGFYICPTPEAELYREVATIGLSSVWGVIAIGILLLLLHSHDAQLTTVRNLFLIQLIVISISRAIFFAVIIANVELGFSFYILWSLPAVVLFSTFALLVWVWADNYYKLSAGAEVPLDKARGTRKRVLIAINLGVFLVQLGIYLIGTFQLHLYMYVQPIFLSVVAVAAVVSYVLYCSLILFRIMTRVVVQSSTIRSRSRKFTYQIGGITIMVFCTFCVRAGINIFWVSTIDGLPCKSYWLFFGCFYTFVEVLPTVAISFLVISIMRQSLAQANQPAGSSFRKPLLSAFGI